MNQLAEKFPNFVIFQMATGKVNIDVFFQNETLWLTQKSLADLFEVKVAAVSKHLKNIFETHELLEDSVVSIMEKTAHDGKKFKMKRGRFPFPSNGRGGELFCCMHEWQEV